MTSSQLLADESPPDFLLLVPYESYHVPKYHDWMAGDSLLSHELRQLTASEPLSLEEEYSLQAVWRNDENKLTFIVLHGSTWWKCYKNNSSITREQCEVEAMIGDVNIFLYPVHVDEDANDEHCESPKMIGELELMIAEPRFRRCGYGRRIVQCMAHYAHNVLKLEELCVKIGEANTASQQLFQTEGFKMTNHNSVFQEVELKLCLPGKCISPSLPYEVIDSRLLR